MSMNDDYKRLFDWVDQNIPGGFSSRNLDLQQSQAILDYETDRTAFNNMMQKLHSQIQQKSKRGKGIDFRKHFLFTAMDSIVDEFRDDAEEIVESDFGIQVDKRIKSLDEKLNNFSDDEFENTFAKASEVGIAKSMNKVKGVEFDIDDVRERSSFKNLMKSIQKRKLEEAEEDIIADEEVEAAENLLESKQLNKELEDLVKPKVLRFRKRTDDLSKKSKSELLSKSFNLSLTKKKNKIRSLKGWETRRSKNISRFLEIF